MSTTGPEFEADAVTGSPDEWRENEREAERRIRDDATRSLGENLNEALALSAVQVELRNGMRRSLSRKQA